MEIYLNESDVNMSLRSCSIFSLNVSQEARRLKASSGLCGWNEKQGFYRLSKVCVRKSSVIELVLVYPMALVSLELKNYSHNLIVKPKSCSNLSNIVIFTSFFLVNV